MTGVSGNDNGARACLPAGRGMVRIMKITYTKHSEEDKFSLFKKRGINLTKRQIKSVIENPDNLDEVSDIPNIIASKKLNKKHVLRVVYKIEGDIIKVITFYPAEKGRYY